LRNSERRAQLNTTTENQKKNSPGLTNLLLTGATGFVGKAVLARLVGKPQYGRIYLLVRTRGNANAESRVADVLRTVFPSDQAMALASRIIPVAGDFTLPGLGLSEQDLALLRADVHQILHCGASTDFGAPLEEARQQNTEGTRQVLNVALNMRETGVLRRLDYVSTAFVAGIKRGLVNENDLDRGQAFANSYEQSKFEAEKLLAEYANRLPITIYRPSIIVGDSTTGYTPHFKVLYWPVLLLARKMTSLIVCNKRAYLDVVPVDYVADGIVALMQEDSAPGQTFLLSAGLGNEIKIGELLQDANKFAGVQHGRSLPFWLFKWMIKTPLRRMFSEQFLSVVALASPYHSYLAGNGVRFDASKSQEILKRLGVRNRFWKNYREPVLRYCVDSRWGKRLPQPEHQYYMQCAHASRDLNML